MNSDKVKPYLDYLDKEMTIMGILSTFCILSLGLVVDKMVLGGNTGQAYWTQSFVYGSMAMLALLVAALFFYRQRSLLAYYVGQLSLYYAKEDTHLLETHMDHADAWNTWNYYKAGWGALGTAFAMLGLVFLSGQYAFLQKHQGVVTLVTLLLFILSFGLPIYACWKFPFEERPLKSLFSRSSRR